MDVRLIVLGSGQDGGSPQFGSAAVEVPTPERSASSIAVVAGDDVVLFDASIDLRRQWASHLRTVATAPSAVFLTHAHMGHYAGLLHFGPEAASTRHVPVWAPATMLAFLEANEPWASLLRDGHLDGHALDEEPVRHGRLSVTGLPVPHRADHSSAVGFSVAVDDEPWCLYLPDIDTWTTWSDGAEVIARHRVALLDATFGSADELPSRPMAEVPHPPVTDTIERFAHLAPGRRVVLTHLNHTNPLGIPDSPLRRRAEAAGFEVAVDGMVIRR